MMKMIACTIAVGTALSGCGRTTHESAALESTGREPVTLRATNYHHQDVDVFVIGAGQQLRLGMIISGETQVFPIPSTFAYGTQLQLRIHPIGGGGDYFSDRVMVAPGEEVVLNVTPIIDQTSYSVFQSRTFAYPR